MQAIRQLASISRSPVFQVYGVDFDSQVVLHRQLNRRYVLANCLSQP